MIRMQDIKKMINKKNPLVSVLINNYNKESFCVKAVQSVIDQDYKNLEVIFYDDNSSDNSIIKIKELKKKLKIKKIKIIENKFRQKIFSYNQIEGIRKSLSKSNGEIICILDSDDFFKKNKIKKIVDKFKKNKSFEILFDTPLYYYNDKNKKKINKNYKLRINKWPSFPPTSCISFRRKSLFIAIKSIDIKKNEELWFDFRVATYFAIKKNQFNLINDTLTYYRQDDFSFDKSYKKYINKKWWKRREEAFNFLFYLKRDLYNKNIFTLDFLVTKIINKIYSFF